MKKAAPAWLSGVHIRKRGSLGHSHSASWIVVIVAIEPVVPITPLGLPVVPPVYVMPTTVSDGSSSGTSGPGVCLSVRALMSVPRSEEPNVRTWLRQWTFSSRARARSAKSGSTISVSTPASAST